MKLSEFKSDMFYWSEQKISEFKNEHQTEVFVKGLKQYIHTSGQIIQIQEQDRKWRDITGQMVAPSWNKLED